MTTNDPQAEAYNENFPKKEITPNMKLIDANPYITLDIEFKCTAEPDGFPFNIGALELSVEGRNFVTDSVQSYHDYDDYNGIYSFDVYFTIDLETFEKGEEYNYELTVEDLKNPNIKATFYCGDNGDEEFDEIIDWDSGMALLNIEGIETDIVVELEG